MLQQIIDRAYFMKCMGKSVDEIAKKINLEFEATAYVNKTELYVRLRSTGEEPSESVRVL